MKDSMPNQGTGRAADIAREAQERVAAAWVELIEAAKTEPKARAFLEAFAAEAVPICRTHLGAIPPSPAK